MTRMTYQDFLTRIVTLVEKCVYLKNTFVAEKDLCVDYVCLFSHSREEFNELCQHTLRLGTVVEETQTGPLYRIEQHIQTVAGSPKVLKIRKPDVTKMQLGDVDFTTDYLDFKKRYEHNEHFSLIVREKFEMLELNDGKSDVLVYFSSIQPSKLAGVS